jgi:hypothetical protein
MQRIYDCLAWAPAMVAKAHAIANKIHSDAKGRPVGILSARMHTGYPLLLMQALNVAGVRTFKAEHGSAPGQSPLHTALARFTNANVPTDTLFYTEAQVEDARKIFGNGIACALVGAPRCVKKPRLYQLQRFLMRRRLAVNGRHVVWCTGIYPNNEQMLPHYWIDGPYHLLRKELINHCLNGLSDRVTIKLHPAARYVDGDPLYKGMPLPKNCFAIPDQDFRYLRSAADVVVVDGPGSVLGWAMGLGVPIIYVEFGMYILTEETEAAFRNGMLFVDVRSDGWRKELRELLELPHDELKARYKAKESKRKLLCEKFISGPEGSSAKRAVDYIRNSLLSPI